MKILRSFLAVGLLGLPLVTAAAPAPAAELVAALELEEAPVALRDLPGWQKPRRIGVRAGSAERLAWFQEVAPGVELVDIGAGTEAIAKHGVDALIGACEPAVVKAAGRGLRWIQIFSAGAEPCVGSPGVQGSDILVTNMQRVSGPEIAEHVLALMLALNHGLHVYLPAQAEGRWAKGARPPQKTWELKDRTLLVVGLGGIGTEVARRAHALGMRVVATRASAAPRPKFVADVGPPSALLSLAASADVVVNCTPLVPETENLFNATFFDTVKRGSYFINVGRGRSVDQKALLAALNDGRLGGAGLDVTEPEPLPPTDPLWKAPNLIITPHVSANSDQVFERVYSVARENLRRFVAGERMLSVVDKSRGY